MADVKHTPAQQQYRDMKAEYPDCILFFRMGDFYETFGDDALVCAKLLDLTVTSRDRNSENPLPMAGIPYHAADKYIPKLVNFGHKVAIAEQMSEPKAGQIVQRAVTHIVTPATSIDEGKKEYTYISAVTYTGGDAASYQCVWGDVTVGAYRTRSFRTLPELVTHLQRLQPREVVLDIHFPQETELRVSLAQMTACLISPYDIPSDIDVHLRHLLGVQTLASFGKALDEGRERAFALLTNYLQRVQPHAVQTIVRVQYDATTDDVTLDAVTLKNLEVLISQYEGSRQYSLLGVIDTTATSLGARLLREMLMHPTQNIALIEQRQAYIMNFFTNRADAVRLQEILQQMIDMPKIVATLLYKKTTPTIFGKLRYALGLVYQYPEVIEALRHVAVADEALHVSEELWKHLVALLKVDGLNDDIDYIADGYDAQVDELRQIAYHSDSLVLAYQQELVQASGVSNVKVKYVNTQGYVLEVTPKDSDAFEAASQRGDAKFEYIRRHTLKTGQRYTTVYLDELQQKVLSAQFQLRSREQSLIEVAKAKLIEAVLALGQLADGIAQIDVYSAHALFAARAGRVQPEVMRDGAMDIRDGRHPVIQAYLPHDQQFIPNDLHIGYDETKLGEGDGRTQREDSEQSGGLLHIITGPNMGGKSTFLRQNALIMLLAQCGLYVPARAAKIPVVDGMFARVGSGDVIAKNQSTFMTEMIEMANIVHNATARSFIILDELGRGTSTYDGMALAHAIVQYIVQHIGAKTLFATHYHELIALEASLPGVMNFSVNVYETETDVVFMKKIVRGGASKSYGLDVAKIAGIPSVIVDTAKKYLAVHEAQMYTRPVSGKQEHHNAGDGIGGSSSERPVSSPLPLFAMHVDQEAIAAKSELDRMRRLLKSLDVNNMTPMEALAMIARLQGEV